jgi:hypothetical protein
MLNFSENLSQQQFKELLEDIYIKGLESEFVQTKEIVRDIQIKLMALLETSN